MEFDEEFHRKIDEFLEGQTEAIKKLGPVFDSTQPPQIPEAEEIELDCALLAWRYCCRN